MRSGDFGSRVRFLSPSGVEGTSSNIGLRRLFQGRDWDETAGLYDFRARWMHPQLGRFTQRDPIGWWGDLVNLGGSQPFAGNDPWLTTDPTGLQSSGRACERISAWAPDAWHHLFPQAIFGKGPGKEIVDRVGLNIHEYGWILPKIDHDGIHSIEALGEEEWNSAWKRWLGLQDPHTLTKEALEHRLNSMLAHPRYKPFLQGGARATMSYGEWTRFSNQFSRSVRRFANGGKAVAGQAAAAARKHGGKALVALALITAYNTAQAEGIDAVNNFIYEDTIPGMVIKGGVNIGYKVAEKSPEMLDAATDIPTLTTVSNGFGGWNPEIGYAPFSACPNDQ